MSGRKSVYEEKIKSRFDDIKKWKENGANERQIANALGIAYSTFNKYKASNKELVDLLNSADKTQIVSDLRSALLKRAYGFKYEETKKYKTTDEDGNTRTHIEITEKMALPDVAAINLALKNYDSERWSNDPALLKLKKEEFEFKKEIALKEEW